MELLVSKVATATAQNCRSNKPAAPSLRRGAAPSLRPSCLARGANHRQGCHGRPGDRRRRADEDVLRGLLHYQLKMSLMQLHTKHHGENVFTPLDSEGYKFNDETKEWEDNVIIKENRICCICYNRPCKC